MLPFSDINKPPIANAGPDVVVHLPNRAAELDGSRSHDDHGIVVYDWSRDPKSPAAGVSVNIALEKAPFVVLGTLGDDDKNWRGRRRLKKKIESRIYFEREDAHFILA